MDKYIKFLQLILNPFLNILLAVVIKWYKKQNAIMPFNPGVLTSNHVMTTSPVRGAFILKKGKIATKMAQIATENSYRNY